MSYAFRSILFLVLGLLFAPIVNAQKIDATGDGKILYDGGDRSDANGPASGSPARQNAPDRDDGGFVVTAFLGASQTARTSLGISQPDLNTDLTFDDVRLASRSFDPPLYYGLRAGYFFPGRVSFGAEAEFVHLKVYADPHQRVRVRGTLRGAPLGGDVRLGDIVQQYSISHGANLLLFNAAVRKGFGGRAAGRRRLILSARAGIGPTIPHTESSIEGRRQEQYEIGPLAWQAAGGAEFRLWRGLYALGEYKYTQTNQRGKIYQGTAESNLRTHHGVFGLSLHF